jgi:hypothetical protein
MTARFRLIAEVHAQTIRDIIRCCCETRALDRNAHLHGRLESLFAIERQRTSNDVGDRCRDV